MRFDDAKGEPVGCVLRTFQRRLDLRCAPRTLHKFNALGLLTDSAYNQSDRPTGAVKSKLTPLIKNIKKLKADR
jgi:hypothetical protein